MLAYVLFVSIENRISFLVVLGSNEIDGILGCAVEMLNKFQYEHQKYMYSNQMIRLEMLENFKCDV